MSETTHEEAIATLIDAAVEAIHTLRAVARLEDAPLTRIVGSIGALRHAIHKAGGPEEVTL